MSLTPTPSPTRTPALKPPHGETPNFDDPPSLTKWSNLTIAVCIPVVSVFFLLRFYVRSWVKRCWIFEDWLALLGWAGTVSYCAVTSATMAHHAGVHGWDLTPEEIHTALYWFNISTIIYGVFILMVKLAVLQLYRRVFSPRRRSPFDLTIQALIVIMVMFYSVSTFVKIFECTPRARIFDKTVKGTCVDVGALLNASGLFNTITDFIILFIPVKAVWNLHVNRRKKAIVVLVFTFGLCAPIFSLVGFVERLRILGNPDVTWYQPEILLWGAAELTTGNLCVCFPEMGALFRRPKRRGPSDSILQGESGSRPVGSRTHGFAKKGFAGSNGESHSDLAGNRGSYIELEDENMYSVDITTVHNRSEPPVEGTVHVRHDVVVH